MTAPPPLKGVRIVEIDAIGPVPFAAMLLADLGCEVVRVTQPESNADAIVPALYRGRRNVTLDFRHPAAIAELLDLTAHADGLVEGMRPGFMESLGLGPAQCRRRNPRLVYGRASQWGQDGPLSGRPGADINVLALTGALHAIGGPDAPSVPLNLIGDHAGCALFLALGMVAGVLGAQATGQGRVVDAAALDGVTTLMALTHSLFASGRWADRRGANVVDGGAPFYRTYACADDRHVAVGAIEPGAFAKLCEGLAIDPAKVQQFDRAGWPAMAAAFAARFAREPRDAWTRRFADGTACVTPVLSLGEAARDPGVVARLPVAAGPGGAASAPLFQPRTGIAGPPQSAEIAEILARWR
ncbi:CaiB/BaiF CoA-transferase family protein [Sphingomonas sp.]|uniref:CaiB/BaiF CoA transferase family protein n=1 Tax=Sphingomonas sp. TaxID=28214 RepID=UPI001EBCF169|nr:CaiB/BaiF CoA-transferase family protein [Sphingomonas sp.]MBX3595284.1 CoA transferase [Sphingomonas sp.]